MSKSKEGGSGGGGFEDIELGDPSFHRLSFIPNLIPIKTMYGVVKVFKEGADLSPKKPVILTYHDIGLNGSSNFRSFFNHHDVQPILIKFSVIHINAPGQEDKGARYSDDLHYPTMDQMADQIGAICKHFEINHFIGLGTGAGANILSRFALRYPDFVDGLFLIDCTSTVASWSEWGYQNLNIHYLKNLDASGLGSLIPAAVSDYLLWHHFGTIDEDRNQDLIFQLRSYFSEKNIHPHNLALFISSFLARTDLGLVRGSDKQSFQCPVLLLTSFHSPHIEDTVYMNSRLNPQQSQWMKLSDCGMPLEEQPGKVAEALRLFIQGLGYSLKAN